MIEDQTVNNIKKLCNENIKESELSKDFDEIFNKAKSDKSQEILNIIDNDGDLVNVLTNIKKDCSITIAKANTKKNKPITEKPYTYGLVSLSGHILILIEKYEIVNKKLDVPSIKEYENEIKDNISSF